MDCPLNDLLDEHACYDFLVDALHAGGLGCPACGSRHLTSHRAHRDPVLDYRCACGRIFNAWTGTALQGTQRRPSELVLIARGLAQGTPTARRARELECSRWHLLELRQRLQHLAWRAWPRRPLPDAEAAADEMFQNAGKKGTKHGHPDDPPRRRANKVRGHGTWDTARPPVLGVVGRDTGLVQLGGAETVDAATLQWFVGPATRPDVVLDTAAWGGDAWVARTGRTHASGCPTAGEWAREDDGDGLREVHPNTREGLGTGLRNLLRSFRGVNKWFLEAYVGIFQWVHTLQAVTADFIRALFGLRLTTDLGP